MTLSEIRKSNRAKLSRLEKKGYTFSEEYKNYVRNAKGKLETKNIRGNVLAITDKNDRLWIHERNFGRYMNYDTVQMDKVSMYRAQSNNAARVKDTKRSEELRKIIFSGEISNKPPKHLNREQEEMRKQRLKDPESIPEYGTDRYWEWRDFERNKDVFIEYGVEHGLSKSFMEAAANNIGVMYRFNNSEEFIERYIYSDYLSENDTSTFIYDILGNDFLEEMGETYDSILQALY